MPDNKGPAFRKRTQIAKANRAMFVWVAIISAIFGFAVVGATFLTQMLIFNEKVLAEKAQTIKILESNNNNISQLQDAIRVLDTNQTLESVKSDPEDQTIQVILDSLPSDANSLALGASLQNKLLSGIDGLTLNSLQVKPVAGVEALSYDGSELSSSNSNEISFNFSVSGNEVALKQALVNLEKSIRTIDILSLEIQNQSSTRVMDISARAFYQPERVVELKDKVVR